MIAFLSACSTPIKQAGQEHATAIAKWNELARYSETRLNEFSIAITAQLALVSYEQNYAYQLKNIQLKQKESSHNINLLAPEFEHKYICNPVCNQLLEYIENSPTSGSTLLNEYFSLHEFELFSFYGELYKMNENLEKLSTINSTALNDYLNYIRMENRQFQSLNSFSQYLSEQLTEPKYQAYLNNPNATAIREKTSQFVGIFKESLKANAEWFSPSEDYSPEIADWQPAINTDKNNLSQFSESQNWLPAVHTDNSVMSQFPENSIWEKPQLRPRTSALGSPENLIHGNFLIAKNDDILPGNFVCSYSDNKFGRVRRMSDSSVDVELIGQAKILQDGIFYDLEAGALFKDEYPSLTFLPIKGSELFSILMLARCYPE